MTESQLRTFYSLKSRRPVTLTPREHLLMHRMHVCPGCNLHDIPRKEKVFARRVGQRHTAYVMYWRTHIEEYNKLMLTIS